MKEIKRTIGPIALMFTGLGSIIGSGWLFGAWHAAKIAGPAAIFAWVIGAFVALTIAVTYSELGTMFPETGGMVRYARYSHGAVVGFIAAWSNWIALATVIPIEAIASVQYMASWPFSWAHGLAAGEDLTISGLLASGALVFVYFLLNFWGVKLFIKTNSAITVFKFVVPGVTVAGLLWSGFHVQNFALGSSGKFAPYGWSSILTAVATSGVIFSFNGFQCPVSLAGETANPRRSIPFALIGSILCALVIYVLLQVAFIGAVSPSLVALGWHGVNFSSPFAELAISLNLNWLAILLYMDAFVSPSGTGTIYTATTARMIYAMERSRTMPKILGTIDPVYGVPRAAMWFNLGVAFVFMFFFRGWGALAAVISVATIIGYLTGPIAVMSLRRNAADLPRPLRIKAMPIFAPLAFVCASLVLYWARWPLTGEIFLLVAAGFPIYLYYQWKLGFGDFRSELRSAWWILAYFPAMALLSKFGGQQFGGTGSIPDGWDLLVVSVTSFAFYEWGIRSGGRTKYLSEHEAPAFAEADKGIVFQPAE